MKLVVPATKVEAPEVPLPPTAAASATSPLTWEEAQKLPVGTKISSKKKPNSYAPPVLVRTKEGWNLLSGVVHAPRKGDLTAEWKIVVTE